MHPLPPTRRQALLALGAAATATLLPGCSGSDDDDDDSGIATLRAINLTSDLPSVDILFDDNLRFAALATDALAANVQLSSADYTAKVRRAGDATTLLTGTYTLAGDGHYTAIVWGRENALRLTTLPEDDNTDDITSGSSRIRIFSATLDSGTVDVYLTAPGTDIADATPTVAGVTAGLLTGFAELSVGTYRLRVTGSGDPYDLRLDIPAITLADKQFQTLVLTPGAGGVLVNALQVRQQGSLTAMKNTQARLRVVASADGAGSVNVALAGRTLAGGLRSPSIGPYQLVDTTSGAFTVRLNGTVVDSTVRTLAAGADYTLVVMGGGGVVLLTDDNRLPSNASRLKMRLVHGAAGFDALTLSLDYLSLVADLAAGAGSGYVITPANNSARVDVTAPSVVAPVFSDTDATLLASSVYTVFVLGGNATPTGLIRKER
jgi:hypothetical protein